MAGLHFDITGDNANFLRKLDEARNGVRTTSNQIEESGVSIEQMFGRLAKGAAAFGAGITAKEIVSNIVRVRGEFQQLEVAFNTMLGSEQKATALMSQLVKTAATTPFDLQSVAQGAKQLLAYGDNVENVNEDLVRLGNIAAGLSQPLNDLVYLYGTTMTQGRLYTADFNQFTGRGIPMIKELAKQFNVAESEVKGLVEAGKVGFPEVQKVIQSLTNEGGMFSNLMEKQSKTITGQISNIEDSISTMYNNIGKQSEGIINDALSGVSYLVENYEDIGKTILELAAAYGTYKTAIIVLSAIEKARYTATLAMGAAEKTLTTWQAIRFVSTEKLTSAQKALNAAMLKNPYILVGAAVAGLCYGIYKLITYQTDAEKAQAKLNNTVKEFNSQTAAENAEIDRLFDKLKNTSKETSSYQKTKDEIIKKYGSYLDGLNQEISTLNDVEAAYRAISSAARQAAADRAIAKATQEAQDDWAENRGNVIDKLKGALTSGGKMSDGAAEAFIETINRELKETGRLSDETTKKIEKYNYTITHPETGEVIGSGNSVSWAVDSLKKNDKILDDLYGQINSKFGVNTNEYENLGKSDIDAYIKGFENALSNFKKTRNKQTVQLKTGWVSFGSEEELELQLKKLRSVRNSFDKNNSTNVDKKAASEWLSSYKKTYEDADKAYNDFLKSKQVMSEADRDKELKRLKEERDMAKTTYEGKGGSVSANTKQENQSAKLRQDQEKYKLLMDKQALDQSRSEQDLQNQVAQAKIDSMQDGSAKTLEQMQLNHKKEMQQFEREKEDKLRKAIEDARAIFDAEEDAKKAEKPKYEKKTFDASGVKLSDSDTKQYDTQKGFIGEKQKRETEEYYKSLRDSYQDYADQRIAIEEKFNADIATLQEARKKYDQEGNTEKVQQTDRAIAQATKDKGQGLMQLDYDKLKESPEYVRAFENLKQTSSETLNSLLSQLENAKHTAAKVLSPDQLREYTTTIQEIMDELDSRNPWQALSDKKQELADAEQELAQAQIELENARQTAETVKGGGKVEYTTTKFNQKTGKIDSTKAYLTEAQALDNVKDKTDKYNKSKDNVVDKNADVKKSEKDVADQIDGLSKAISDVGAAIGGPAGEIITLIGDIGSFTMMAINGVKTAADTSAQAISTIEKASVILMIISAAIQLATKVADMFAADYSDYNESKENYEKYVEVLDMVIGKQKELIETLTGKEAVKASEDALRLIEKQAQAARNLGKERLNAGASAGSHSIGVRIKDGMSSSGWNEAKNALGVNDYNKIKDGRMTGLFDLSVEQLKKLQLEAPEFWAKLDDDVSEYLEQIIACNENAEEMKAILNETLTGVSFDSFREGFLETLSDMDSSSQDFAKSFEGYLQKAILNSLITEKYDNRISNLYKKWSAYSGDDEGLTPEEAEELKKEQQDIAKDALADRDSILKDFGLISGESSSQDSTKGGFETMSQDTGEELNGRFTALQISNEEIKNSMTLICSNLSSLCTTAQDGNIFLMEMRNLAIMSNSYLEDIAGFQKKIVNDFGRRLESIDSGIQKFNSK